MLVERPAAEGEPVDFGIMANVDRKFRVEEEVPDAGRVRLLQGEFAQLARELPALFRGRDKLG